jgi:acetyltransferase-like isoleucine patch superfamily enzyme
MEELIFKRKGIDLFIDKTSVIKQPRLVELGNHVAIDVGVYMSTKAYIGDYVHIAPYACIIGGKDSELVMEHFSGISAGCKILCGSDDYTKGLMNPQVPIEYRNTKISFVKFEKFSCIGVNSTVMPGVTLTEGSVVGSNSVITKDTEPWTIYVGSPARPIKMRDRNLIIENAKKLGYEF